MLIQRDTVRPGVLVLINDTDWEILGGLDARLNGGDKQMNECPAPVKRVRFDHCPIYAADDHRHNRRRPSPQFPFFGGTSKRNLHRKICADLWLAIFRCLSPAELWLKIALLSGRFGALVDTHFKGRRVTIGHFNIQRSTLYSLRFCAQIVKVYADGGAEYFPLPSDPPPRYIVGFREITIRCVDPDVMAFLRLIRSLLSPGVCVSLGPLDDHQRSWQFVVEQSPLWPLLAPSIVSLGCYGAECLSLLRRHSSPTVLRDLTALRSVRSGDLVPGGTSDDSDGTTPSDQALSKWLHTVRPGDDGRRPNLLHCHNFCCISNIDTKVEELIEAFLRATSPVSYAIVLRLLKYATDIEPFETENERTRERMALSRRNLSTNCDEWLIRRGPIDAEANRWAKWAEESGGDGLNVIVIDIRE
ncbi:hypothetical protein niasHS_006248 [Heterodera schachtii]|uniref:Ubiquitin-related modifier 1 n=1 Tax=Heterodera schachtii TaxID=97005 RepID=A0ABD2JSS6_HETSC